MEQGQDTDDEKPRPTRGYAHLAEFMNKTHHGMMRRFRDLSTLNLLYLQAELYQLGDELDEETGRDMLCGEDSERKFWDYHWWLLATSEVRTDGKRWKIWLELREKLYEYRECLSHSSPSPPLLRKFGIISGSSIYSELGLIVARLERTQ